MGEEDQEIEDEKAELSNVDEGDVVTSDNEVSAIAGGEVLPTLETPSRGAPEDFFSQTGLTEAVFACPVLLGAAGEVSSAPRTVAPSETAGLETHTGGDHGGEGQVRPSPSGAPALEGPLLAE